MVYAKGPRRQPSGKQRLIWPDRWATLLRSFARRPRCYGATTTRFLEKKRVAQSSRSLLRFPMGSSGVVSMTPKPCVHFSADPWHRSKSQAIALASWATLACPRGVSSRRLLSKFGWVIPLSRKVQR